MLLPEGAPESAVNELNQALGVYKPLCVQYTIFIVSVARGEFGESFQYKVPARRVVTGRIPATVQLGLAAMTLTLIVAVPIGVIAGARRGSLADYGTMSLAVLGQALPNFWLGIVLIIVFGVKLRWLPTSGSATPKHIILPAITLAAYPVALIARLIRSNIIEVLSKDYVRTARSKGLAEWQVVMRHALKNAAIPVVTVVGLLFGLLLGGAVITESIFGWPGIGKLVVDAILWRDYPIVQTVLILSASVFVVINLITDLFYGLIDPRIRYE